MASDDLADELFELQMENRSLKDTIQALRDELEAAANTVRHPAKRARTT